MSQSIIHGVIKEQSGKPVKYANILLFKSLDSSLVRGTVSDSSGRYSFEITSGGEYFTKASFTGMEAISSKIFKVNMDRSEIDQGVSYLSKEDVKLAEVTVAVKKPMFEQKIDRMVINVKNSITDAGGTALDVLEKSPGVTVNRQNNAIAINGKSGVTVMINGKINYMPMDALVQLLTATPASNIEKIELITSPPSKYDASGNAGYINIVLINNPYEGLSGSYSVTGGYGNRESGAAGINLNYRSGKINLYGNYSFNHDHYIQPLTGFTGFMRGGDFITNTSFSNRDATMDVQNLRIGVDYQLSSSTAIGALISGYNSRWSMIAHNGATISKNNVPDTIINTLNDPEINHWQNAMTNFNFEHTFKYGGKLSFDLNYIYYKDNNPTNYFTDYYNHASELLYHEDLKAGKITPINFKVISSDYTTPLGKKITMEAGAKISLSRFNNDVVVNNLKQGVWITDSSFSSNYLLKENIGAAYTSFVLSLPGKTSVTAGLRYEYTTSDLGTTQTAHIINRKYGELFPTFYFSKKINEHNSINFSYNRRITRPAFNDLAPFTIFFSPRTFFAGNPELQPAVANSIQASYGFRNYSITVSYTHEANTIDNFFFQTKRIDTVSNILYLSARNYKYQQLLNAALSIPVVVTKWWSMQNNINGNWQQVSTTYDNAPLLFEHFDYNLNSTQHFSISKDLSAEITGFYSSASYLGTAKRKPIYLLDAGVQKKFGNKKDVLRITANDIFNSESFYRVSENLPLKGAVVRQSFNYGLVSYKLTYTHNFGNKAPKDKRQRSTGAEDELKRVHN
jgi:hypothetical protein